MSRVVAELRVADPALWLELDAALPADAPLSTWTVEERSPTARLVVDR